MPQTYPDIPSTKALRDSRQDILDRDEAVRSAFSGTTFPSTNLVVGMFCFRTDLGQVYELTATSPVTWTRIPLGVPVPVGQGGTGATDAAVARTNLGLAALAVKNTVAAAATVADARFLKAPIENLLKPDFISSRRASIDRDHASENPSAGRIFGDTTYLTVVDRNRMAVSLITSISGVFGSGLVVPGTGVILNNRLSDFVLIPGHPNAAGPGKRVRHTILPSMMLSPDGQLKMSFGCMGGNMQPQGQVQILLNLIDRGMNLQQALDAPRVRVLDGRRVSIEPHPMPDLGRRLASMGHVVVWDGSAPASSGDVGESFEGSAQAIMLEPESLCGASDPRLDGIACPL